MSERDPNETAVDAEAAECPNGPEIPDPRALALAVLPLLDALMPTADTSTPEVRACHM
jgi:hypothetical protein